ncbi:hypothetical protein M9458_030833, partial [Cirrhinus mrigala]
FLRAQRQAETRGSILTAALQLQKRQQRTITVIIATAIISLAITRIVISLNDTPLL